MSQVGQPSGSGANIVLVEDDTTMAEVLKDALQAKDYCVWHATTAAEAHTLFTEIRPDVVLLDLILPDVSGLVLLADIKAWLNGTVPVIVCSATRRRDDRLLVFKLGADDFVPKPFDLAELEGRVEVALRRHAGGRTPKPPVAGAPAGQQRAGRLAVDHPRCRVTVGDEELRLTPTEYRLLCALVDRPNQVLSRHDLAHHVWGSVDAGIIGSLETHMRRLRHKLRTAPQPAPEIVTVRGFGYRLVPEPAAAAVPSAAG